MTAYEAQTRRDFLKKLGTLSAAALLPSSSLLLSGCDINASSFILKDGKVFINGSYRKTDILITDGKIVRIGKPSMQEERKLKRSNVTVLDCRDQYISPGWVDMHCHVGQIGPGVASIAINSGVTALVDAGSFGPGNFTHFLILMQANSRIPIYSFLNMRKRGITIANILTKNRPGTEDVEGALRLVEKHPDIIKGFKVRSDHSNSLPDDPAYYARITAEAAGDANLPVMYHLGKPDPSIDDFLSYARPGDIITHCFRERNNCVLNYNGDIKTNVRLAKNEGVLFDVGHGAASFSFDTASRALDHGFDDFTISSDLWIAPSVYSAINLPNVMSKLLALGMSIEDITLRSAVRPRQILSLESEIKVGARIDLTVFSVENRFLPYFDSERKSLRYPKRIVPKNSIIDGEVNQCGFSSEELT
jgi:dihydroorotase